MKKRILAIIFTVAVILSVCACSTAESGEDDVTTVAEFLKAMDDICASGDKLAEEGLHLQSKSYYAFAGASVSSLRYAVENILWLKGEGDTIESLTDGDLYAGWDSIASVSYASPYPYYFEGLIYHVQGKNDEAADAYLNALENPAYPEDGVNFYYLKQKTVKELYSLRDELRETESRIYVRFVPDTVSVERDPYMFEPAYLRAKSREALKAEDYNLAAKYAIIAVQNDPFDVQSFKNAALCCMYANDINRVAEYVDAGLVLAPDDEGLKTFYTAFEKIGGTEQ